MTAFLPVGLLALGRLHRRHFFGGILLLLLILVLIALGVVLIVRLLRKPRAAAPEPPLGRFVPPAAGVDPVLGELRLRYARGDISREEYQRRAADLGYPSEGASAPPPWPPSTGGYPQPPAGAGGGSG